MTITFAFRSRKGRASPRSVMAGCFDFRTMPAMMSHQPSQRLSKSPGHTKKIAGGIHSRAGIHPGVQHDDHLRFSIAQGQSFAAQRNGRVLRLPDHAGNDVPPAEPASVQESRAYKED